MSTPNANRADGDLVVTTVLTREPSLIREMAFMQMRADAKRLHDWLGKHEFLIQRPRKGDEEFIRTCVDDLNECVALLGQVGWRKRKGDR